MDMEIDTNETANSSSQSTTTTTSGAEGRERKPEEVQSKPVAVVVRSVSKKSTGGMQRVLKDPVPPPIEAPKPRFALEELKFMQDFDPTTSSRQQKRKKRYHPIDGRLIQYADDFDDCDCLKRDCPGCHYPCRTCGDRRCGHECRVNRKWIYDSVEIEGRNQELKNPHSSSFFS